MKQFIPGAAYKSATHGWVEFKGVDVFAGETVLKFQDLRFEGAYHFWKPEALAFHFAEEPLA